MQSNKTCKGRGYLLEDLAGLAGCDYLSDLRCAPSFRYPIFVALSLLFAEDYSVKEWTDAVKYIAVSYTHLDVYKRQACTLATAGITAR